MSKKGEAAKSGGTAEEDVAPVSGEDIKAIYWALYGSEQDYEVLMQEHHDLTHYHQIRMELEKEIIAERRRKRREVVEARRREEELRRIKEMRENPANLNACAAKIQKYVRRNRMRREYERALRSLADKPSKRALVVIGNCYEDRRVRTDVQAVVDAFDLARLLLCCGFRVDLLCDVPPYEDFLAQYDEPLSQSDASGRYFSPSTLPSLASGGGSPGSSPSSSPVPGATGGAAAALLNLVNHLGSSALLRQVKAPTRQNIVAALEEISKEPDDTLVWVHVATVGGRAVVNGKNPARTAAEAAVRTPRTRLLTALQQSSRASPSNSGNTAATAAAASDTCHFIFPSDGKSSRLTFDSIVRADEVLDVLSSRHAQHQVFGHALHQRIVTMDIAPIGCVEGYQGGGFACFASTCTATLFWEMPAKEVPPSWIPIVGGGSAAAASSGITRGCSLGDPQCGLLTHALSQCLVGHCWSRMESVPRLFCGHLAAYLVRTMSAHGIAVEERSRKGWGDFPVLEGDQLAASMALVERVFGWTTTSQGSLLQAASNSNAPAVAAAGSGGSASLAATTATAAATHTTATAGSPSFGGTLGATTTAGGVVGGGGGKALRPQKGSNTRGVLCEITLRFDLTEERNGALGMDVFDPEFPALLGHLILFYGQHDLQTTAYRQLKAPALRSQPSRTVLIGINSTFVEVAAKMKTKPASSESSLWGELVSELTGIPQASAHFPLFSTTIAKQHEGGGILLVVSVPSGEVMERVVSRLPRIADVIPGVTHNALMVDVRCEYFAHMSTVEQLSLRAKQVAAVPATLGMITPFVPESPKAEEDEDDNETRGPSSPSRADKDLASPSRGGGVAAPTFPTAPHIEGGGGGKASPLGPKRGSASSLAPKALLPDFFRKASGTAAAAAAAKRAKAPRVSGNSSGGGNGGRGAAGGGVGASDAAMVNPFALSEGEFIVQREQLQNAVALGMTFIHVPSLTSPTPAMLHVWGDFMDYCVQQIGNKAQKNVRILKHKLNAIRVMAVRPLAMRVNDLDDVGFALLGKRDRPPTPLAQHGGTAVCVVAMYNPTGEARCRQALHLARVAQAMEVVAGIRFFLWDVNNESFGMGPGGGPGAGRIAGGLAALSLTATSGGGSGGAGSGLPPLASSAAGGAAAGAAGASQASAGPADAAAAAASSATTAAQTLANPRAALMKFLESLRLAVGTNAAAYPCLMLWDTGRKRFYRVKAPPATSSTSSPSPAGGNTAAAAATSGTALVRSMSLGPLPPFVTGLNSNAPTSVPRGSVSVGGGAAAAALLDAGGTSATTAAARLSARVPPGGLDSSRARTDTPPLTGGGAWRKSIAPPNHNISGSGEDTHQQQQQAPLYSGPTYHSTAHIIYPAAAIAHFCDEFLRGGLNDLLPPVKGSKVIGGGHSTTKYSLIPL